MLQRSLTRKLLVFSTSVIVTFASLSLRAAIPTAPTGLTASVNGLNVTFNWSAAGNSPTQYFLQAGLVPGQTLVEFAVGATTTFPAAGPAGTYYVRVVAANAEGRSPASNEVIVVLSGGCAAPGPPINLRAIVRGSEAFIFWNRPLTGSPVGYVLQAGTAPGTTFTSIATTDLTYNPPAIAGGTYYLRVVATSACGTSAPSNELPVTFGTNTVRVADPDPGTSLGMPDVAALVARIHNENPGLINQSCPTGRKYEPNPWQNRLVDRLREYDTHFGYNAKPTRGPADNNGFPVIAAGDEISFFAGAGIGEGSRNVYTFDVLFDHCGSNPSQSVFRNIAPEESQWTGAGRFSG